jgi:hypothetical protein
MNTIRKNVLIALAAIGFAGAAIAQTAASLRRKSSKAAMARP